MKPPDAPAPAVRAPEEPAIARLVASRFTRIVVTLVVVHALAFVVATRADDGHRRDDAPTPVAALAAWRLHVADMARGRPTWLPGPRRQSVDALVVDHLPPTLALLAAAFAVAVPLGLALGVLGVDRHTGRVRGAIALLATVGFAMPAFYFGILGIRGSRAVATLAGSDAWLLPASGYGLDRHLLLPTLALAMRPAAELAQLTAELLSVEVGREYLRMARAKGAPPRRALWHALANAAPVQIAALAATLRHVVSSAIVVELLFNWPGIGLALARSVAPRIDGRPPSATLFHAPTVAALVTVWTLVYLVAGLAAEVATARLDPRLVRGRRMVDA